jgi:hypothetical protein
MNRLLEYFQQYALLSLEKQDKLDRLIGDRLSELDLDAGKIRFGSVLEFPFQVLGAASDNTLTWLWAWSEEQAEMPEGLMQSALELKAWGVREGLPEFSGPETDVNRADGHMISLIASMVIKASCYYCDSYQGGALFLLLFGEAIDSQPPFDRARLVHHLTELGSAYEVDQRKMLLAYLRARDLAFVEDARKVTGRLESGEMVDMEFDERGRLLNP